MLNFYDFEVFQHDWMVVIVNLEWKTVTRIHNDVEELREYYRSHKKEIWVGYNSRNYDVWILRAILSGIDPYAISNRIIGGKPAYQIADLQGLQFKYPLYDYDNSTLFRSLKQLEGFMGNDICETSVPFDIDRPLTEEEIEQTFKYCQHDVEQLMEVWYHTKYDFDTHINLIKTFKQNIKFISKTKAQLTAQILGCKKVDRVDEWRLSIVPTLDIQKYSEVVEWFKDRENHDYSKSLKIDVAGIPHTFGWGGLHGCIDHPVNIKGNLIHVDVTSFYPSIMIKYGFLTRNCESPEKYKHIYDTRVALKKAGKKAEQAPYKIILNSIYGISKDKHSLAYDPKQANNVCINGQLLLLDLLEHLEGKCEIVQSNTDGIILNLTDDNFDEIKSICNEWEVRTGMGLGFDFISEIWQKDVNNYIFKFEDGSLERKGGYVKELSPLDYDLPIVNKAMVEYLVNGVSIEETINSCDDLKEFQKIVKLSGKYKYAWHNDKKLSEKCNRVFASLNVMDTYIGKQKTDGATIEKFANTPDRCFIWNESVNGVAVPDHLNKQWYINLANKRLSDFGVM